MTPSEQSKQRAREILNRYYDFPTQRLQYKPCLDELTAVLEFYLRKLEVIQEPRVQEESRLRSLSPEVGE
jgi:hypothetical protein